MVVIAGHRGYRGKYPENTMMAFENAYSTVDIIETDLQMTADGIVVINHDSTTGRMWNKNYNIDKTNYSTLANLRCKVEPLSHLPTLELFLNWLIENPNVTAILDIKFTNDKLILLKTYSLMLSIKNDIKYWQTRIIFGLWMPDWFKYGYETGVLKDFRVMVITFSMDILEQFMDYSKKLNNDHYKLFAVSIHFVATWTERYRYELQPILHKEDIKTFVWTINKALDFQMTSQVPGIYGVVTDFPEEARILCEQYYKPDALTEKFTLPRFNTTEGFRVRFYLAIYNFFAALVMSKWVHYPIFGFSFAHLIFFFLRYIAFL
ncbi:hypothetical protein TBLA_0B05330 [Henningerozyma blattae CBS 6284]|uniref:GP-PDE domain-containing protein n=1 Tax=Henningerozyma blattae (strain ATCC 34711 / CBS 6284 / DSM 70876 / NBRC 10599 / NRRL Y-10934 / UCD 77-7) TaxID=1071380 RepID=I2GZ13_HENB6|nr:hypothetical protein TBLA_0B05330 [Tetrapisispora blattae CBS 6284]CCH59365.1 hypothetical protein TBLA_0B05330 [Tetrapisispora blattae CBS 6284]